MFVQSPINNNNNQKRSNSPSSTNETNNIINSSIIIKSDELMFDFEDISALHNKKTSEIQELALDVVSKMVESWLDPNNLINDHQAACSCKKDVLDHIAEFSSSSSSSKLNNSASSSSSSFEATSNCSSSTLNKRLNYADGEHNHEDDDDDDEDRIHQNDDTSNNEKRPRCNTGDKTAARCSNNEEIVNFNKIDEQLHFADDAEATAKKEYFQLVVLHLPIILRLCLACPFGKVREKCRGILKSVKDKGLPIPFPNEFGPSGFILQLPFMGTCNDKIHTLFADAFLQNSRLDHVSQVMGYHPSYLEQFLKTQNFILRGDGPLPFDYRHYIAIMAAGRHRCSYLIALQKQEFLLQGGDQNWLRGLKCVPQKLRNLYDINKILAHRPWLLRTSHIEKLTKGGKDSWSLAEVVHAIVILTHFHSLCSFVFSCGVNQELDHAGGYGYPGSGSSHHHHQHNNSSVAQNSQKAVAAASPSQEPEWTETLHPPPSPTEPEVGITTLMQRMKTLSEQTEECTPVELAKRFENIEVQSAELGVVGPDPKEAPADISYFIDDPNFQYQDFAKRTETDIHTFRVQDYSWDDHGYSTVNRLYNDVGTLLDCKFKTAYNLTYYTMGGRTDVDTSRFRRSIWNYIQALLGIRHDDYDYGEINALVEKSLKSFIKTAGCYPERVTKKVYDRVMREFEHSEKVHVNLMVLESRMQAELIYALRTVNRYMTM